MPVNDDGVLLNTKITNALLLGWAIAETLGHARRGTRPGNPARERGTTPRLTLSDNPDRTKSDQYLLSVERVLQIYASFEFEAAEHLTPLTEQVHARLERIRAWFQNPRNPAVKANELRDVFEPWTRQVAARLNALSPEAYRAFIAGMSIADTYWSLQIPVRQSEQERAKATWRRMLSRKRLEVEQRRLRTLIPYLPPYVVPVICKHLDQWCIGESLDYEGGQLRARNARATAPISIQDEDAIQDALRDQVRQWARMLFGAWEATSYLRARDRRLINWLRRIFTFCIMLPLGLVLGLVVWFLSFFLFAFFIPLLIQLLMQSRAGISDWLGLGSFTLTLLLLIPGPFLIRVAFQGTRSAQQWIDSQLTVEFIAQRTYVPWDRHLHDGKHSESQ
ncbi:MAG TPA: hypothetical protein VFD70_24305 [Anaerolineae bacterium]|nr:hypothetical protein [Anaerolineae bacterium]